MILSGHDRLDCLEDGCTPSRGCATGRAEPNRTRGDAGTTPSERKRLKKLERENRELENRGRSVAPVEPGNEGAAIDDCAGHGYACRRQIGRPK